MSGFDRVRDMALAYPESNPFNMHPPLHNLRPKFAQDPPVLDPFLAAIAREESGGDNLFSNMLGESPLYFGSGALPPDSPLPCGEKLAPLHRIHARQFKFRRVRSLTRHRNLKDGVYDGPLVFQIKVGDEMRVLKVFPRAEGLSEKDEEAVCVRPPVVRFRKERRAYNRLSHHGVCAQGIVPQCFGWLHLDKKSIERMGLQGRGAYALVLEYLVDAQPITSHNITIDIADKALRGLREIHAAFVGHYDTEGKGNILLLPRDRVVWIDFDLSCCGSSTTRGYLRYELAECWSYFYNVLVPNRVIDWHED